MTKNSRKKTGFMVVEIIVAAAIITATVLAGSSVAQKSIRVSNQGLHSSQAAFLLEEGAEAVRIVRDNNWSNISTLTAGTNYYPTYTGGTWTLSATANQVGRFTRKVVVSNVNRDASTGDIVSSGGAYDSGTKFFTITVSWLEQATTISKSVSFYISDIFS